MEDHGGEISLRAHPSHGGTRAEIVLPILDTQRFPLLVIEEDALVQRALVNALKTEGFSVDSTTDPGGAVPNPIVPPSVVILDTPAPLEAQHLMVELVRTRYPNAKLLAIVDSLAARGAVADEVLARPWSRQQLLSAVRRLCLTARPRPLLP